MSSFFQFPKLREAWAYRNEPEQMRILAVGFWRIMLLIAVIAVACGLWFGYQEIGAVSEAEDVKAPTAAQSQPFSPIQLQSEIDALTAKQNAYQALSTSSLPAIADPSQ